MALYTIGEVAVLCDINPVTLRAWQRRYGLLKPQRTDGGHRLFDDDDIERIREIKRWIENGVQVGKVKALLGCELQDLESGWRERQELLLHHLQSGSPNRLRTWMADIGRDYPAETLVHQLYTPLRRRLQCHQVTLNTLLSLLDGALINYIALCLASARKRSGKDALLVGWDTPDTTRLWMAAWMAIQQGWRIDVLAHPLHQLRPELFAHQTLLVWCGDTPTTHQLDQLELWRCAGMQIFPLMSNGQSTERA
ncbi:MerR family transcriptional regulator [Buttiauxella noackiae]|uniref:MerR family transcriptional regulator n=1 Tax=Buttiauxella noackiae TaxID=82992 RepID=UPI0028D71B7C|nr:MerR family transcriptional regulator [Buttiauxella noackiae]